MHCFRREGICFSHIDELYELPKYMLHKISCKALRWKERKCKMIFRFKCLISTITLKPNERHDDDDDDNDDNDNDHINNVNDNNTEMTHTYCEHFR